MNERFQERVERKLGELSAKVDIILSEIKSMKNHINSLTERTIRNEEKIDDCNKKLEEHLKWHEQEKGFSIQWRIAIFAGVIALASSLLSVFLAKII